MSTCSKCSQTFLLRRDHQGFAHVCPNCSEGDVDRVMGKVAWSGKHTMELEITSNRAEAIRFNNLQRRWGAGVTRSLCESKEGKESAMENGKKGSGAEAGAQYFSALGEKRNVKR